MPNTLESYNLIKRYKTAGVKSGKEFKKHWELYVFLVLPLLYLAVFSYGPMVGFQIAFKDYNPNLGIFGSEFIGFKYFAKFFSNYQFWRLVKNTLVLSTYMLAASFPMSLLLALCLNAMRNKRYKKVVQTVTYLPHFISVVVLVGMMIQIFNPLIGTYGRIWTYIFNSPAPNIIGIPTAFSHMYVWSDVWQNMGYNSIIYVAALSAVDPELYEAAQIDGASRLKMVRHIDLPTIIPTIVIMLILQCGRLMSIGYEKVLVMQNNFNLPYSEIIQTYIYKQGLSISGNYSYATAVGLFNSLINFIMILTVNKVSNKVSDLGLW